MAKKYYIITILVLSLFSSCVKNPNVTADVYVTTANATDNWAAGMRRQLALMMSAVVLNTEITSDNYYNNYTEYTKVFDVPQILYSDADVNTLQTQVETLREMAKYGLNSVIPNDTSAKASNKAFITFCYGFSSLLSGELFVALPGSSKGTVLTPTEHYNLALNYFNQALALEPDSANVHAYKLLKARTFYDMGNQDSAVFYAQTAKASSNLLFQVSFDGTNSVTNEMQNAVFTALPNRLAPLPRLDFLDPKYYNEGTASLYQKPITITKEEEAYLIIAEAYIASNNLSSARQEMKTLIDYIVASRPVVLVDDSKETRNGGNRKDYPLTAVKVRFRSDDSLRSGYVLNRQAGKISVHTVSGTKVTDGDIDAATSTDQLLYLLYRLRQEIFFGEGRRMTDLGIKFPISQTEQLNNAHVTTAETVAQIPSFIPLSRAMDDFSVDAATGNVTMAYDMNSVLVANKHSIYIFPFIQ